MLSGSCHCGACGWTMSAAPDRATACNCTMCRRYGALWAYGVEGDTVAMTGPLSAYVRAHDADPSLEVRFCSVCAGVLGRRGLRSDGEGRRRVAVNLRLAPPESVAGVPLRRFDGLETWQSVTSDGRCIRDLWF